MPVKMSKSATAAIVDASTPAQARRWASIKQTAEYLGVTTRTIGDMIAAGRLRAYRNGSGRGLVRLDLAEFDTNTIDCPDCGPDCEYNDPYYQQAKE
jgi:excisionase family DNA binding protein